MAVPLSCAIGVIWIELVNAEKMISILSDVRETGIARISVVAWVVVNPGQRFIRRSWRLPRAVVVERVALASGRRSGRQPPSDTLRWQVNCSRPGSARTCGRLWLAEACTLQRDVAGPRRLQALFEVLEYWLCGNNL